MALRANNDKRIESIDSTKTCPCGTSKDLKSKKEEIKRNNIKNSTKIINFDDVTKENIKEHNPNWLYILYHSYRL